MLLLTSFQLKAEVARYARTAVILSGDVNSNGEIDILDSTAIRRYLVGSDVSGFNYAAADVDADGVIDVLDAARINRCLAGYTDDGHIGVALRELCKPREMICACAGSVSVQLQWDAPKAGADGYEVFIRAAANDAEDCFLADVDEPLYEAQALLPNTEYVFSIRSYRIIDGHRCSADSAAEISVITMAPPVKDMKIVLTVDHVYMTWEASEGADGYEIYCDKGDGPELFDETDRASYRSGDIAGNTGYRFSVRTFKYVNGVKTVSTEETSEDGRSSPSMPGFTVTREKGAYTLKWGKTKGADKYEVMMQTPDEEDMRVVASTDALTYSIPAEGIPEAMFAVRSVNCTDGKEYRSEYCKKSCSQYKPTGTIGSFGDSIAFALGANQFGYAEIIGFDNKLRVDNRGVNSATLSKTDGKHCICDDVLSDVNGSSKYDYILVDGGINDYYNNSPLGTVTPDGADGFDRTTVCGALETIFSHIRAEAPSAKTVFVLVHDINDTGSDENERGLTFLDYTAGIKEVCEKYGITIADCGAELRTADKDTARQYTFTWRGVYPNGDGIHPNEEGYKRFYVPVIEEKLFGR